MTELAELFRQACGLSESERRAFLAELMHRDARLASELQELLAQDQHGGPVASTPSEDQRAPHAVAARQGEEQELGKFTGEALRTLSTHSPGFTRYLPRGELARGGMGILLKVWDTDIGREVAMKIVRTPAGNEAGTTPGTSARRLARFLDEARITGRLEHPGIVPVHELGIDAEGRVYFTMQLVQGRELGQVFELAAAGREGWNRTRALEVLLKVCDALSYAHSRGVVHRDLKPSNVMVGPFGQVYVMDWGLARTAEGGARDIRPRPEVEVPGSTGIRLDSDTPVATMDGAILGTPWYMPPEQASGQVELVDERSDVYALGAMLYHLVAGRMPYVEPGVSAQPYVVLRRVNAGPPESLGTLAPDAPAELVAICEHAMARERSQRYPDVAALAGDLRAFLDRRVVQAYETGAWAEARKWVQRNRGLASALSAAVVLLVSGSTTTLFLKHRSELHAAEAEEQRGLAAESAALAEERRLAAERNAELADQRRLDAERNEADAQRQRETWRQMADFLVGLFDGASPDIAQGHATTARELLDAGRRKIEHGLQSDPLVRAQLLFAIGKAYGTLGVYEEAEPLLSEALELSRAQRGETHAQTLELALELGSVLRDAGRYAEAETLLVQTADEMRNVLGEEHRQTLRARWALGSMLLLQGRYEEAAALLEDVVARDRKLLGSDDFDTLSAVGDLASTYERLGRLPEAELLRKEAYEHLQVTFGDGSPGTLIALHNLATLMHSLGKLDESAELFQSCLERSSEVFGADHPYVLHTLNNLGVVREQQGHLDEAATIYRECLDKSARVLGADHPLRFTLLHNLGAIAYRKERFEEAEQLFLEALEGSRAHLAPDHPDVLVTLNDLGAVYARLKRYPEAERILEEVLDKRRATLGASHPDTFVSMRNLAGVYEGMGRLEEAEELFAEAYELARAAHGDEHALTRQARGALEQFRSRTAKQH